MIKNRTTQLIYQSFYCALGIVGIIACFGIFDDVTNIRWDFYVHFTNISNFLCIGIMFAELIKTARKKEDSFVNVAPFLKFISVLSIMLTFVVFNLLLAPDRDIQLNLRVGSLIFHATLPIMYIIDWVLFYEHKKVKWNYPLLSVCFPLLYVAFIYIRAAILRFDATAPYIYPYFFLNLNTQGVGGVIKWVLLLMLAFILVGYIFYGIDKVIKPCRKSK